MEDMRYRKLGKTGFEVSEIGYGAWGIGGVQWLGGTDDESLRALRTAIDCGLNFIDTALAYGDGHSEQLVGNVVRGAGRRIYVATKVPPKNQCWPARRGIDIDQVFPYQYVMDSAQTSLGTLGHDAWRRAAQDLKRAGKIRFFGLSINDHDPDSALEAIETGLVDTVQVIYNIFVQSPEARVFPLCQERGVGVIARVPLDEGC